MAAFTSNDSITKVVSSEMNFGQVMLVRGLFAIVLVAAFAWYQGALRPLRTLVQKPVALRVVGEIGGTICFMAALVHLPLANTSAILQALPLAITLGAALIFGEPVGWRRWSAIGVGFVGVLIIVRPGLAGFNQFALLALLSVAFCALRDLATRKIPAHIPSLFITLLTTITVTSAGGLIFIPLGGWTPPSTHSLGLLAFTSVLLLIGYQCIITALRTGDISAVAPFRYSRCCYGRCCSGYRRVRRRARRDDGAGLARPSSSSPASTPSTASASATARWRRRVPVCRRRA